MTLRPHVDLTDRARKYLQQIPDSVEGQQGHNALFRAAAILTHGFALSDDDAFMLLNEYNVSKCAPAWPEKELHRKLREAGKRSHIKPRGHLVGGDNKYQAPNKSRPQALAPAVRVSVTIKDLPELKQPPELKANDNLTLTHFLDACFMPDEQIQIETPEALGKDQKGRPMNKGTVKTATDWNERIGYDPILEGGPAGSYVRINPVKDDEGKDTSILHHRHVLLEWDKDSKVEQLERILRSKLPVSAIVDSGGKSVHAWVKVDAANREEYDARVATVYDLFKDSPPDRQNKNPSRFTRLPFALRGNQVQSLIDINCGLGTWDEWIEWKELQDKAAQDVEQSKAGPRAFSFKQMVKFKADEDPSSVLGNRFLCRGSTCLLVSQTGTGKSALVAHSAISLALGYGLFGIKSNKGRLKSLIIQSENDEGDCSEAIIGTLQSMQIGLESQEIDNLNDSIFFYREAVKTGEAFGDLLRSLIEKHKPDCIWVDPLLGFSGVDLSDQESCSHFLRHIIQPVLGDCILFSVHHTTKPGKDPMAPISSADLAYAGSGSAEIANWHRAVMVLQKDPTPENQVEQPFYTLLLAKRGYRAGLQAKDGSATIRISLRHSRTQGRIAWEQRDAHPDRLEAPPRPISWSGRG